jgi:hypothetical protein
MGAMLFASPSTVGLHKPARRPRLLDGEADGVLDSGALRTRRR